MKKIFSMMLLCAAVVLSSCCKDDSTSDSVAVAFSGLTANGSAKETTTVLTLTLDKAIEGLAAADITLTAGETGTTKGELTVKPNGVYELAVSGISKGGEITVAVAKTGYTITPASKTVTVNCYLNYFVVNGIKVSVGSLVADGANGAKIGAPTDGGLYFQFGSLVGWSGGATGDGTGTIVDGLALTAKVTPTGYNGSTTWNRAWAGDPAQENVGTGTGDPCKYYLKGTWRLPTNDEYMALVNNTTTGWTGATGWSWNNDSKSATHTSGLIFPASGFRDQFDGKLDFLGDYGYFWSSLPLFGSDLKLGHTLLFTSYTLDPSSTIIQSFGAPVRCVQASN